jgi:protein-tyrosine phosphatase
MGSTGAPARVLRYVRNVPAVIDLHCHVLPGIDDGARTMGDSLELARAAVAAGTRTLVATPHVSWEYPNDATTIVRLTTELNERLTAEEVDLDVRAGAEVALTRAAQMSSAELRDLRLGSGPYLLVECPFTPGAAGFDSLLLGLQGQGHGIVLAHPERCPAFQRSPETLRSLVAAGMLTSITAGALVGRFGASVRAFTRDLAREGLIHNVTSDAHDCIRRPPSIADELEQAGLAPLREWLTGEVPAAILEGADIPSRPTSPGSAGRTRRAWRRRHG